MVTTFATVNLHITSGCLGWNYYHALIYFNVRELVSLSFNNIGILGRKNEIRSRNIRKGRRISTQLIVVEYCIQHFITINKPNVLNNIDCDHEIQSSNGC